MAFLLVVIYVAFIGLGVPDFLMGSAWPAIHTDLNIAVEAVSVITFIISGCTVLSSMFSARYRNIIIPENVTMPEATQKMLERFVSFWGKVLRSLSELTPVVKIDGEGLRAMHRKTDDGEIFFLFREKGDSDEYKIYLPSSNGYLLDLTNGTLQNLETYNNVLQLSIAIGETVVVLLTD